MTYDALIEIHQLNRHLEDPDWLVVDCRYDLHDPGFGFKAFSNGHIPGAVFADINTQLSGPVIPGVTGRHPLPEIESIAYTFSRWGIDSHVQVVAYDDGGGKFAARLWWLLKWLGHDNVALLNGGIPHWQAAGLPLETNSSTRESRKFTPHPRPQMIMDLTNLESISKKLLIIDSRAPERYAGKHEPIDPIAGRIPGAINRFYEKNLLADGTFYTPQSLKNEFRTLVNETSPDDVVFYCGSGITGSHNVFAMYASGLGMPKLYPGSWSEWITNPQRPIEREN